MQNITMKCTVSRMSLEDAIKLAHRLRPVVITYGTHQYISAATAESHVSVWHDAGEVYILAQDEAMGIVRLEIFDINTCEKVADKFKGSRELAECDPHDAIEAMTDL